MVLRRGKEFASCHDNEENTDSSDDDYEFGQGQEDVLIHPDTRFVFAHPEAIALPEMEDRFFDVRSFRPKWLPVLLTRHTVLVIGEY